jgi:hypothetical protein
MRQGVYIRGTIKRVNGLPLQKKSYDNLNYRKTVQMLKSKSG